MSLFSYKNKNYKNESLKRKKKKDSTIIGDDLIIIKFLTMFYIKV